MEEQNSQRQFLPKIDRNVTWKADSLTLPKDIRQNAEKTSLNIQKNGTNNFLFKKPVYQQIVPRDT